MVDRVGQQLGNYRLVSLLGRGGFAEVYLGEHIYLKTQVAVKVLQARLANPEDLENFLTEAQTVARLLHPHIIRVLDFGVDNETPFLVMDYAPNGTLRQRHKKGERVPLDTVKQYVKQSAEALQQAHNEKLVHRNVKPENMLLDRRSDILLSDFGIALVAQSSRYQSTQDVIGTVAYMSPEQIQGHPRPASDQYSLAITAYEWLSGERPFNGSFTELCTQHMFATLPPLRAKVPEMPSDVELAITTALAKDPKQRFGNMLAFANALGQTGNHSTAHTEAGSPTILSSTPPLAPTEFARQSQGSLPIVGPEEQKPIRQVAANSSTPPTSQPGASGGYAAPYNGYAASQQWTPTPNPYPYQPQFLPQPASVQPPQRGKLWSLGRGQLIALPVG